MPALGPLPGGPVVSGQLRLLSCPAPLCPHAEFAIATVLATPVSLRWLPQPRVPGQLQAALDYTGPSGTSGHLVARLRPLGPVRFEVTEGGVDGADAERYSWDPDLGLHRAALSAAGEVVVSEGQIRTLLAENMSHEAFVHSLARLLGDPWDAALDGLRQAGEGAPVSWLSRAV